MHASPEGSPDGNIRRHQAEGGNSAQVKVLAGRKLIERSSSELALGVLQNDEMCNRFLMSIPYSLHAHVQTESGTYIDLYLLVNRQECQPPCPGHVDGVPIVKGQWDLGPEKERAAIKANAL